MLLNLNTNRSLYRKCFQVCVYDGDKFEWRNPKELATYDVVLTDYKTMQKENFLKDKATRELRSTYRLRKRSPLLSLNWWRVCSSLTLFIVFHFSKI